MHDLSSFQTIQLDALREVANIGAGHAATALSQMVGEPIMISVPTITVAPVEDISSKVGAPDEPVAAVLLHMMGDLTGRALLVFPRRTAVRLIGILLHRDHDPDDVDLSEMEQSALKEAGNILSSAYMNALSEFMGMVLLPSPPGLAVDMSAAVLSTAYLQFAPEKDVVVCIESEFMMTNTEERLRGFFLLLPDPASLQAILHAVRLG